MLESPTVAVIDVGSNSIKLLVARAGQSAGAVETVFAETIETRISAGISREHPSLSENAMAAGLETIEDLTHLAREYRPLAIQIVATSAVRDAINGMDFTQRVSERTGIEMRVLTGTEEATYIGKGLRADPQIENVHHFNQMDLGGGSLELIRFSHDEIEQAISLQLGAVRLSEQFIKDRATAISVETRYAIQKHVRSAIRSSDFQFSSNGEPLIATGGAVVATRAILAAKAGFAIDKQSAHISSEEIRNLATELSELPLHERMATPNLPAARADILPTALLTIEALLELAGFAGLTHSFYNLRYGLAREMLESK
ncbi:MAG: phosphatase [Coraliomargarita sp.]|nr:phosphatase [Coraliomargarita sp.]